MHQSLDLPDDCWCDPRLNAPVRVGDVYDGLPILSLEDDFELVERAASGDVYGTVVFTIGLVIRVFRTFVVVVPVTTWHDVSDRDLDQFRVIVENARQARDYLRLPPLAVGWHGDALGLLYQPTTLRLGILQLPPVRRLAAMQSHGRSSLRQRLLHTWSPYGAEAETRLRR